MLGRLRVRAKLSVLVIVPSTALALLLVPVLAERFDVARTTDVTARAATVGRDGAVLVEQMQDVRLLGLAYLSSADDDASAFSLAVADAEDTREQLLRLARADGRPELANRLRASSLTELDRGVRSRTTSDIELVDVTSRLIDSVIDGLGLTSVDTVEGPRLAGLDILLRSGEATSRSGALLLVAATGAVSLRPDALERSVEAQAAAGVLGAQFRRLADPGTVALYDAAVNGPSARRVPGQRVQVASAGDGRLSDEVSAAVLAAVRGEGAALELVEAHVAQGVASEARAVSVAAARAAVLVSVVVALVFALVVSLTVLVGRSISGPLRRLTHAAGQVAALAQSELARVADEDVTHDVVPRLAEIEVATDDEIGELAEAFNHVQGSAALLLQRQVVSRRNVATMFAGVGRRTTNLVGRQLALIDRLERAEDDPDTLSMLYRLDHVSTRLRRNAASLVVLSGSTESSDEGRPVALADALRGALGTVEEYQRVAIDRLPAVFLAPAAASDVVLLLAELMENAVLFSPPSSTVEVSAERTEDGGCLLWVADHGLGMSQERLDEENRRLRQRERLDLAPTDVLGLFVVGRLARRHGLGVTLEPTSDHGVTAVVRLPEKLIVESSVLPPARLESRASQHARRFADVTGPAPVSSQPAGQQPAAPVLVLPGEDRERHRTSEPPVVAAGPVVAGPPAASPAVAFDERSVAEQAVAEPRAAGVPRRVPGAQFGSEHFAPLVPPARPAARRTGTVDADLARDELEAVEDAARRAAEAARSQTVVPPSECPGDGVPAAGPPSPPGVRRRVPGRALEGFDDTAADVASPEAVDAHEIRHVLDGIQGGVHQALLSPPERNVRARRREAEAGGRQGGGAGAAGGTSAAGGTTEATHGGGQDARTTARDGVTTDPVLVRRRPGQTLAELEGGVAGADGTGLAPDRRQVQSAPERPEDVLAWAGDLESAIARVDDLLGVDSTAPGAGPERESRREQPAWDAHWSRTDHDISESQETQP